MLVEFAIAMSGIRHLHELQKRALDLRLELQKLSRYVGKLGSSSSPSVFNLSDVPHNLLPRATMFAQYAEQASSMSASQNLMQMKMMGMVPVLGNPLQQQQMEFSAFARFKEEAMKAIKQEEVDYLHKREEEIQLELASVEQRIKEEEGLQKATKEKALSDAQANAPKF